MTDLDPLASPPPEGSELAARSARDQGGDRPRQASAAGPTMVDGPTGHAHGTESHGDPDRASVASGASAGAGGGAMAGAAVGGPIGLPIGAAIGAATGAAAESVDVDKSTNEGGAMSESGSEGTVVAEPVSDAMGEPRDPGSPQR